MLLLGGRKCLVNSNKQTLQLNISLYLVNIWLSKSMVKLYKCIKDKCLVLLVLLPTKKQIKPTEYGDDRVSSAHCDGDVIEYVDPIYYVGVIIDN
jgi:hypothetical protein